jgi:hypothetical protein
LLEHVNDILDETLAQVRLLNWQTWKNGLQPQFASPGPGPFPSTS